MITRLAALVGAALLLAACGGDDGGRFDAQVADVRTAIAADDRDAALAALDELAIAGIGAHEEGAIDDAEVQELAGLIDDARRMIDEQLAAPTTTTTTTTTAPPPPEDSDDDDDHEKPGKGNKGRDKDDD